MRIFNVARELLDIEEDLRRRIGGKDYDKGDLYSFDQTWGSTALGFGGVGGSAMTVARTYVFVPERVEDAYKYGAYVYFGGQFAYKARICDQLVKDIASGQVASVKDSGRYM